MSIADEFKSIIKNAGSGPFLFCGSGFSRRYVNLDTWIELLKRFAPAKMPFEYYLTSANQRLEAVATHMEPDFNAQWWTDAANKPLHAKYAEELKRVNSPLKVAISEHIKNLSNVHGDVDPILDAEIALLKLVNVEGIITTNFDMFLESIFPDYEVYVGQEELFLSNPIGVGEIYKIHGCCTSPNSLILDEEDYNLFRTKHNYLAAKLLTIFIEHPVIFLGYSISDPNIVAILRAILECPGVASGKILQDRLVFIEREKPGRQEGVTRASIALGDAELGITRIVTKDFGEIYRALADIKRKFPAKIARHFKSQFYELIKNEDPNGQLAVVDIESIDDDSIVDFVIGVGIKNAIGDKGYSGGLSIHDLLHDVIFNDKKYDCARIINETLPLLMKSGKFVPVFKYLVELKIELKDAGFPTDKLQNLLPNGKPNYVVNNYLKEFNRDCSGMSFSEISTKYGPDKVAILSLMMDFDKIEVDQLEAFIKANFEKTKNSNYSTYYKKLVCLFDYLKYGFK